MTGERGKLRKAGSGDKKSERGEKRLEREYGSLRGSQHRRKRGQRGRGKEEERRGDAPTILSQCETAFFTLIPVFEDN